MRAFSRAIDRFCCKHRGFGIPRLMLYIIILSIAAFFVYMMDTTEEFLPLLIFYPELILRGEVWRLITWIFLPLNGDVLFTALMLYFYYFIGSTLEREWGAAKFTVYYLFGLVLNLIYGFLVWLIFGSIVSLTPSYLNLSMFFAFAALFPDYRIMLFFFIPVKIKWMALINAAFFAYSIIAGAASGNVLLALLPVIALLNFFILCSEDLVARLRPLKTRASAQSINFKRATRKAERKQHENNYRHKCAVCGKTDTDHPDLEFRYCSRCNGYHCFCLDHINSHIHFDQ